MRKLYFTLASCLFLLALLIECGTNSAWAQQKLQVPDTIKTKTKITDTRPEKPVSTEVGVEITPFKPATKTASVPTSTTKVAPIEDDKTISNVKVFPNPIDDDLNLAYRVNKDTNLTIKIMDVLGNEIATLLSQRVGAGEQVETFNISQLSSGFYFVRLIAGGESIVKRISVL